MAAEIVFSHRGRFANCYLLSGGRGFVLIDSGAAAEKASLVARLTQHGCRPGTLRLVAVTHGDVDHVGNCAFFQAAYGAKIVMHPADRGMAELGNVFWSRKCNNGVLRRLAEVSFELAGLGRLETFRPDALVEDGQDLSDLGLEATVVHIPGHTKGSIGFLTTNRDFFCGDLLSNGKSPARGFLVDDRPSFEQSVEKVKLLQARMVYPGHGRPFSGVGFELRKQHIIPWLAKLAAQALRSDKKPRRREQRPP